jgi:hypothetical protein
MSAAPLACWLVALAGDPELQAAAAWKIFWTIVILIVIVIVTGGVIMFITRWVKRTNRPAQTYGADRASFKVLYERGELTEEEYQKIRARLGQKLKEQIKAGSPNSADNRTPEPGNRLSTAEPESTIRPVDASIKEANELAKQEVKPGDSDPSTKPE